MTEPYVLHGFNPSPYSGPIRAGKRRLQAAGIIGKFAHGGSGWDFRWARASGSNSSYETGLRQPVALLEQTVSLRYLA
jgi:hypothetical protein